MCLYLGKKVETPYQFQILSPTTESTPNEMKPYYYQILQYLDQILELLKS